MRDATRRVEWQLYTHTSHCFLSDGYVPHSTCHEPTRPRIFLFFVSSQIVMLAYTVLLSCVATGQYCTAIATRCLTWVRSKLARWCRSRIGRHRSETVVCLGSGMRSYLTRRLHGPRSVHLSQGPSSGFPDPQLESGSSMKPSDGRVHIYHHR